MITSNGSLGFERVTELPSYCRTVQEATKATLEHTLNADVSHLPSGCIIQVPFMTTLSLFYDRRIEIGSKLFNGVYCILHVYLHYIVLRYCYYILKVSEPRFSCVN